MASVDEGATGGITHRLAPSLFSLLAGNNHNPGVHAGAVIW